MKVTFFKNEKLAAKAIDTKVLGKVTGGIKGDTENVRVVKPK